MENFQHEPTRLSSQEKLRPFTTLWTPSISTRDHMIETGGKNGSGPGKEMCQKNALLTWIKTCLSFLFVSLWTGALMIYQRQNNQDMASCRKRPIGDLKTFYFFVLPSIKEYSFHWRPTQNYISTNNPETFLYNAPSSNNNMFAILYCQINTTVNLLQKLFTIQMYSLCFSCIIY